MDNSQTRAIRQRRHASAALGRDGQRQPIQGRQVHRLVEAAAVELLLHLRQGLCWREELLGFVCYVGGEVGAQ